MKGDKKMASGSVCKNTNLKRKIATAKIISVVATMHNNVLAMTALTQVIKTLAKCTTQKVRIMEETIGHSTLAYWLLLTEELF